MANNEQKDRELKKPDINEIIEVTQLLRKLADRHARGEIPKDDIEVLTNKKTPVLVD